MFRLTIDAQEARLHGVWQLSPGARGRAGSSASGRVQVTPEEASFPIRLRSDECVVEIRYVGRGATTSVMVTDVGTGDRTILDATELESLARGPETELLRLLSGLAGESHGAP